MSVRLALVTAVEALEAGDNRYACDVLLAALEELDDGPQRERRYRCKVCGLAFEWPGQLEDHRRVTCPPWRERWAA